MSNLSLVDPFYSLIWITENYRRNPTEVMMESELAVFGGSPIRRRHWPKWPLATPNTQRCLLDVLHSGKWAISGWSDVSDTFERRLSKAFATYVNRSYCVACSHGSAALSIALQALNVGPGDDVVLTGLTWVACPSAIVRLGARPILVDIEADGLCASASTIERAITRQTRVILMIHMYSSICDVAAYLDVARRSGIALLEDASQAHGASLRDGQIGSFGEISVFSTQQSKLLTSGEGGLCVTDDSVLYQKMQQLRADGRQYRSDPFRASAVCDVHSAAAVGIRGCSAIAPDGYELEAVGDVAGQNLCLTEFQSALLLDGLSRLDQENAHRQTCVDALAKCLESIEGVELILPESYVEKPTYYRLTVRIDRSAFADLSAQEIVPALAVELGTDVRRVDAPLNRHPLYVPARARMVACNSGLRDALEPGRFALPLSERAYEEVVTFPHQILLSAPEDMQDVANALEKVRRCAPRLKARAHQLEIPGDV
ncbi:MAG: DegT/DnrJ/EryC1/StrS family aminotransferase [Acidobacteriota bacterium]